MQPVPGGGGAGPGPGPAVQHCGLAAQPSPSLPQAPATQIDTPPSTDAQVPEQQSAFDRHSSHPVRHPPADAQRMTPSLVGTHWREQQSSSFAQMSSTWAVHGFMSFAMQLGSAAQCRTPSAVAVHVTEQQSAFVAQISPTTRHA